MKFPFGPTFGNTNIKRITIILRHYDLALDILCTFLLDVQFYITLKLLFLSSLTLQRAHTLEVSFQGLNSCHDLCLFGIQYM